MDKAQHYTIYDVYQAAFFILAGFTPTLLRERGEVIFCFEISEQLMQGLSAYNAGEVVRANEFASVIEQLKARVFDIRENAGGI